MKKRAFSLIELAVATLILSMALLLCFVLFQWGTRAAIQGQMRAGIQGEGRRILLGIRNELMRSDFSTLETLSRTSPNAEGQPVPRCALSSATLSNWSDAACFDSDSALPLWNRYMVIYATRSNPGLLIKQLYAPPGAPYAGPMGNLAGLVNDDPGTNANAIQRFTLGQNIESFQVVSDEDSKSVHLDIMLAARGGRKGESGKLNERHQLKFDVRLENSGP